MANYNHKVDYNTGAVYNELDTRLIKVSEDVSFKDSISLNALIRILDSACVTDNRPRKAYTEFTIGKVNGLDEAWEYFYPLNMIVDHGRTSIQPMPPSESTFIEVPYVDGAIRKDTTYKNRNMELYLWSKQGLNTAQKEQLKCDIARLLDSTKEEPKKLTIQKSNICFDVFYSGSADIKSGPSYITAEIPFETSPYGYAPLPQLVRGNGLIMNHGDKDVGFINKITSPYGSYPIENPRFTVGNIEYSLNYTIPGGGYLIINHDNLTCYVVDAYGKKTNTLQYLSGKFQKIKKGATLNVTVPDNSFSPEFLETIVPEKFLWNK